MTEKKTDILQEASYTKIFLQGLGLVKSDETEEEMIDKVKTMLEDVLRKKKISYHFKKSSEMYEGDKLVSLKYLMQGGPFKGLILRGRININDQRVTVSLWSKNGEEPYGVLTLGKISDYYIIKSVLLKRWAEYAEKAPLVAMGDRED